MARTDAFLAALDAGARPDALDELLAAVERKEGPEAHVRCVDAWAQKLVRDDAAPEDIQWIRSRLAMALENASAARGPRAPEFALEALRLHSELLDDPEGKDRVAAVALTLTSSDPDRVFVAVDAVGGMDDAIALLRRHVKSPEVKAEPLYVAQVRRAISHLHGLVGEHEPAFFEALKVLRKAPFEPLYIDEALALAAVTGRNEELALVLRDLAKDDTLPARTRASMYNKVANLLERDLEDPAGAYDAYLDSLRLTPDAKGPTRHARRLAAELDRTFEAPPPSPEATVDQPTPESLLSWSSNGDDESVTGAEVELDRTEAVVPQGEFSTSPSIPERAAIRATEPTPLPDDGVPIGVIPEGATSELPSFADDDDDAGGLVDIGADDDVFGEDTVQARPSTERASAESDDDEIEEENEDGGFGEETIQAPEPSTEQGPSGPKAPRAVTIPGAASPSAKTAMELNSQERGGDHVDNPPRKVSGPPVPPPLEENEDEADDEDTAQRLEDAAATLEIGASDVVASQTLQSEPVGNDSANSPTEAATAVEQPPASESPKAATPAGESAEKDDVSVFAGAGADHEDFSAGGVFEDDEPAAAFGALGGGPTLADAPLPSDAPGAKKSEAVNAPDADGGLVDNAAPAPGQNAGLSATGVPLDALAGLEDDGEGGFADAETSGVFSAGGSSGAGDVDDANRSVGNATLVDSGFTLEAESPAALPEMTEKRPRPKMVAGPSLASESSSALPQSESATAASETAVADPPSASSGVAKSAKSNAQEKAPSSRRKRKRKERKREKREKAKKERQGTKPNLEIADSLLPGMRPEDLLPDRLASSPGRKVPSLKREQPELEASEDVEVTIAEEAPSPPTVAGDSEASAAHSGADVAPPDGSAAAKQPASELQIVDDESPPPGEVGSREGDAAEDVVPPDADVPDADAPEADAPEAKEAVVAAAAVDVPVQTDVLVREALASKDARAAFDLAQQVLGAGEATDAALQLAAHVISLELADGLPSDDATLLFLGAMVGHEDAGLEAAATLKESLGEDAPLLTRFFVDVSHAAGHRGGTQPLLESLALIDAPGGDAFERLDTFLSARDDVDERLQLWAKARHQARDDDHRRALDEGRLRQLRALGREDQWRALHAEIALDFPRDEEVRTAALQAWADAPAKERARFLGRLALALEGEDVAIDLYRETLALRLQTEDDLGAEAAARELLKVRPGDRGALEALTEVLGRAPHRRDDLAETLRTRRLIGANTKDFDEVAFAGIALFELLVETDALDEAFDSLHQAVLSAPSQVPLLQRYVSALKEHGRWRPLLDAVDAFAPNVEDEATAVELWVTAAEVAHQQLDDVAYARKCIEEALELAPRDPGALMLRAELASAAGDPEGAYQALERLAGEVAAGEQRAAIHLRMGFILEDDLDRPEDAIRRYRAAADANTQSSEALAALRALSLKQGDHEQAATALRGLIGLEQVPRLRSVLLKQLAASLEAIDDDSGAVLALSQALDVDPLDADARDRLVGHVAQQVGFENADAALSAPNALFVERFFDQLSPLSSVEPAAAKVELPFVIRRVLALAFEQQGEDIRARGAFERLLDEEPTDQLSLRALARLLLKLETDDAQERRLGLLEQLILHHGPNLDDTEQVQTWADVCALRKATGKPAGALAAARRAFALAADDTLRSEISTEAAEAAIAVFAHGDEPTDARFLVSAHRLLAGREGREHAAERLAAAAAVAEENLDDKALARQLLEDAVAFAPQLRAPREALLQFDIREGDPDKAIATTETLLESEDEPLRRAGHHLRLSKLYLRAREDPKAAADHLRQAIELDPDNATALDDAEVLFSEQEDAAGLAALYSAQLSALPLDRTQSRYQLLERLAQVRRYDLRDLAGAAEALEAMGAIDPHAIKPREDAARLYAEMGRFKDASRAWRSVLDRDPVHQGAWRALSALYSQTAKVDEGFCVASAMAAVEIADEEVVRAVRLARPPFPRWPKVPRDVGKLRQRLGHDLERSPIRTVFEVSGQRLFRVFARPLKEFGIRKKDHLTERDVPGSVALAVRVTSQLLGLREPPRLVRAELGSIEGAAPPFALLPTPDPGLIVTDDVIRGGMTPERAFALGRAMVWLTPHGLLAGTLDAATLRQTLEALVHLYLPARDVEDDGPEVRKLAKTIQAKLEKGLGPKDIVALQKSISDALRGYVHARHQRSIGDWISGVAYTGDRLGFLLAGDLIPSFRVLQELGGENDVLGARLSIKELVLFSVSPEYLNLRRDLGLALSDGEGDDLMQLL